MKVTRYTDKYDAMAHEQSIPTETDPKGMMIYEVSDKQFKIIIINKVNISEKLFVSQMRIFTKR